jgi:hypothetical protein
MTSIGRTTAHLVFIAATTATFVTGAMSAAASASDPCVGPSEIYACAHTSRGPVVDPDGGPTVGDCVYLVSDTCTPVYVTLPGANPSNLPYVSVYCKDTGEDCGISPY